MSMQRMPESRESREGSEESFSGMIPLTPEPPPVSFEEGLLPPPQDMGEDG